MILIRCLLCVFIWYSISCHKSKVQSHSLITEETKVSEDGVYITLSHHKSSIFEVEKIRFKDFILSIKTSARIVASTIRGSALNKSLLLFDTSSSAEIFSNYVKFKVEYSRSREQLNRINDLYRNNAASGKDVLDSRTSFKETEADLRQAESELRQLGFTPTILDKLPSGFVLVFADVPESQISAVSVGEHTLLEFSSFQGSIFKGRVIAISDVVDPVTRTIRVQISMPNIHSTIRPGMFAQVTINEKVIRSLSVPRDALVSVNARTYCFVKTSEVTFERREVITGIDDQETKTTQIISGINVDEDIVVTNAILLKGISFSY